MRGLFNLPFTTLAQPQNGKMVTLQKLILLENKLLCMVLFENDTDNE